MVGKSDLQQNSSTRVISNTQIMKQNFVFFSCFAPIYSHIYYSTSNFLNRLQSLTYFRWPDQQKRENILVQQDILKPPRLQLEDKY